MSDRAGVRLAGLRLAAAAAMLCVAGALAQSAGSGDGARPTFAQPAAKTPTISVQAKLVNVPVVVRDKKGALVTNLTKEDFALTVDTKPQTIRYFDRDTDLPLTLGLLVDVSQSQAKALDQERVASSAFLDTMVTPQRDKAFVIQFAKQVELLQDLTDSRPKLQAALKAIDVEPQSAQNDSSTNSGSNSGQRGRLGGGGTTLYDAVFLASDELMSKQTGRKALVVLSDGDDRGSKENLTSAIEAAQRADVMVYAIYFKGDSPRDNGGYQRPMGGGRRGGGMGWPGGGYPGGGGGYPGGGGGRSGGGGGQEMRVDGKKVLQRMADETGGRLFEMTKKQTADDIYKQIAEELRSQYRLAFTPDAETASDGYHQIDLALKVKDGKNMSIQTRDGYYTGK